MPVYSEPYTVRQELQAEDTSCPQPEVDITNPERGPTQASVAETDRSRL
jgi:hypothetical protein